MLYGSAPDINCIEPDFTVSGSKEWNLLTPQEPAEALFVPAVKVAVKEPSKIQHAPDPKWPLAVYWPVYLSNFMVNEWDEQFWYDQVSDFFAHHGLQTRMIYFHTLDSNFLEVQRLSSLIDALVYFSSMEEAARAMVKCHRSLYYGHKLNVLPGRTPKYFDNERSVRLVRKDVKAMQKPETSLENLLTPFGRVEFTTRQSKDSVLLEFTNTDCLVQALPSQKTWKPVHLKGLVQKQRFVEGDVKSGITWAIESQEGFMQQRPRPEVAQYFEDGIQPIVETCWRPSLQPRSSQDKQDRDAQLRRLWKQRKKQVPFGKLTKWQKEKLYENLCREAGYGKKRGKKAKKVQAGVLRFCKEAKTGQTCPDLAKAAICRAQRIARRDRKNCGVNLSL